MSGPPGWAGKKTQMAGHLHPWPFWPQGLEGVVMIQQDGVQTAVLKVSTPGLTLALPLTSLVTLVQSS